MDEHQSLGKLGEDIAAKYLEKKGYKIVERNYRKKWGELDIIAVAPDKTLVLVEVKTVSGVNPRITGEDQMTASKRIKFRRVAEIYANGDGRSLVQEERGWQMDLITVGSAETKARVRHYHNV